MSLVHVRSRLRYQVDEPTSFVFCTMTATTPHQRVRQEELVLQPDLNFDIAHVGLGDNRVVRVRADEGHFLFAYDADVVVEPQVRGEHALEEHEHHELPHTVLPYLNPSRYCPSDRLGRWADREFGEVEPGHKRIDAICDWVHDNLEYVVGSTSSETDACEILIQRSGVCRDFAHVAITLCRALCIPARYVSGYAAGLDPPDFHGHFEVFLGATWWSFDATKRAPRTGFVRIGTGRDAADCAFATIVGAARLESIDVEATALGEAPRSLSKGTAISTA
jgi:transglutaminase-like putative cysteine protease